MFYWPLSALRFDDTFTAAQATESRGGQGCSQTAFCRNGRDLRILSRLRIKVDCLFATVAHRLGSRSFGSFLHINQRIVWMFFVGIRRVFYRRRPASRRHSTRYQKTKSIFNLSVLLFLKFQISLKCVMCLHKTRYQLSNLPPNLSRFQQTLQPAATVHGLQKLWSLFNVY